MANNATTLYAIVRMFFSEKFVAFCRLVISLRRGCRQVPGLSATGEGAGFVGVDCIGVDMAMIRLVPRSRIGSGVKLNKAGNGLSEPQMDGSRSSILPVS